MKWCLQAAEAVSYVHSKGVLHCDLRPANFLVTESLDLRLCDFGGSKHGELYGRGLPNAGFYDPHRDDMISHSTDIFALGSCFYTIMAGHFPHATGVMKTYEEEEAYFEMAKRLLLRRQFPNLENFAIGHIISACWTSDVTAQSVLEGIYDMQVK